MNYKRLCLVFFWQIELHLHCAPTLNDLIFDGVDKEALQDQDKL